MKKICDEEKIKNNFSFIDFDGLESQNENIRIGFQESVSSITYNDVCMGAIKDEFFMNEKILLNFTKFLCERLSENECIVYNYDEEWVKNKKSSRKLYRLLKQNHIKDRKTKMILVEDIPGELNLFTKSILRYNTFAVFVFPINRLMIGISDHMDMFVGCEDVLVRKNVEMIVKNFNEVYRTELGYEETLVIS